MKRWKKQLLRLDSKISKTLHINDKNSFIALILKLFAHSGDSWFWLAGLCITWLLSEGEWRQRSVFIAVGLAVLSGTVILMKFAVRRPRPVGEWGKVYRITDPHSFPSGHASRAAALAIMGIAAGPTWFAIVLVLWWPWVGLSRVSLGVHYFSDVAAGWIVGALMGWIAIALQPLILQVLSVLL